MNAMKYVEFLNSVKCDPNNERGERNRRNTPIESYNCGGFALSVYKWVTPYIMTDNNFYDADEELYTDTKRENIMLDLYNHDLTEDAIENTMVKLDTEYLLATYPFLEKVNLEDCAPDDMVIAYRLFIEWDNSIGDIEDTDFHFKVRYHGFWFEKMGTDKVTQCELIPDDLWEYSNAVYSSDIVYFRTKRATL